MDRYFYLFTQPSYTNHVDNFEIELDPVYCIYDGQRSSTQEIAICFTMDCAINLVEGLNRND